MTGRRNNRRHLIFIQKCRQFTNQSWLRINRDISGLIQEAYDNHNAGPLELSWKDVLRVHLNSDQTADVNRALCRLLSIGIGQPAPRELGTRGTNFLAIQFIPVPAMLANWPADIDIYPIRYFEPA